MAVTTTRLRGGLAEKWAGGEVGPSARRLFGSARLEIVSKNVGTVRS